MRIGISGAGGTGKTVLSYALGHELSLPVIDEMVREWLTEYGVVSPLELSLGDQFELQVRFFSWKLHEESRLSRFVSDRTVIDGMAITTARIGNIAFKRRLADIRSTAWEHASQAYHLVIVPPPPVGIEFDPVRDRSLERRLLEHRRVVKLLRLRGVAILYHDGDLRSTVEQVITKLG